MASRALLLLALVAAAGAQDSDPAAAECGPRPTVVLVQKGEKRRLLPLVQTSGSIQQLLSALRPDAGGGDREARGGDLVTSGGDLATSESERRAVLAERLAERVAGSGWGLKDAEEAAADSAEIEGSGWGEAERKEQEAAKATGQDVGVEEHKARPQDAGKGTSPATRYGGGGGAHRRIGAHLRPWYRIGGSLPAPPPVWAPYWDHQRPLSSRRPGARPRPGHVYFPGQFGRGGRLRPAFGRRSATYRPSRGDTFRAAAPAERDLLAPGEAPPPWLGQTDAAEGFREPDDRLFRFRPSLLWPEQPELSYQRLQPRSVRDPRSAQTDCQWQIQTEPHLYLLVTLHNLSAPLTSDCADAYIEVERENDGFEARWCGNRVRQSGTRPHLVFARGEVRIAVHSDGAAQPGSLPTGFDAEVEVIDLLDARQYASFRRSGLNFRHLIHEPVLPPS
ncbi:uncharacterized protein LOC119098336 [Pollicipes pollicipes]|uniref:uncharacterized protein LOC119098336 n=1 Tax=Pollicipes pollicipes TaxID=41117 RepID=UPI0018849E7F|nr:uncharacterized protein LOC119098336 [Pollicipes pollicipes]